MSNQWKMIEVYKAKGELEAQVIKGMLASYGIPCLFQSHAASSVHTFAIDGMGEVRLLVSEDQVDEAKRLIRSDYDA
ncbi:MAG: DUF2007 domain-containing protein [Dehalococcoidia bacterium]|nr:MAG: DUF2007 domain-containing protein [Dehalococcoidia bacterium]